jgi:signal transduction histidine kinase
MRLKTRLTLWALFLVSAPLSAAVGLLTVRAEDDFARAFARRRQGLEQGLEQRFDQLTGALDEALRRTSEDTLLHTELLEPMAHRRFYGDQQREHEVIKEAKRLVTASPEVDTLRIVDLEGGRVIAMGHREGVEPPDQEVRELLTRAAGSHRLFRQERLENPATGTADPVWTLQVARVIKTGPLPDRVALVAGKVLDQKLIAGYLGAPEAGVALVLRDARGGRIAASFEGDAPPPVAGGYAVSTRAFTNPGASAPAATLEVHAARTELEATIRELWTTAGMVGASSALLAFLVSLVLARRVSRPLERLSAAASQVAAGDREVVVRELRGKDEVAGLTRAFNQMTLDLALGEEKLRQSERVAAWREIARRIAHEIKNPLFPIQMSIETLQKVWKRQHPDFEEIFDESTATILEEVERMKRIVSEFSNFARMPPPAYRPVDLGELVRQVLGLHRELAGGVALCQEGPPHLTIDADPDQVRQALTNLVQNAIEALRPAAKEGAAGDGQGEGEVRVALETLPEGWARLAVVDDGPGMDGETRQKLFVPYFTTKPGGTGLGLAIVHRIVEEHGGRIRVTSTPGEGTSFVIELPSARPPA